ncbi:MAG: NAD(P)/FAD-dependent oxidoreductase [Alphaproteobacteria bacterium]
MEHDVIVIGGGLVGAAIAYGLTQRGLDTAMLDEGDVAFRASVGNFGLVWVQSKGDGMPEYARWTRRSAGLWPGFAAQLAKRSGIDVGFRQPGGLHLCLDDDELADRQGFLERMRGQIGADGYDARLLDRMETAVLAPAIGPRVVGATYCPQDGHVNPLLLLRALHSASRNRGLHHLPGTPVVSVQPLGEGYLVRRSDGAKIRGQRIVLAAGLGNAGLVERLGQRFPVRPQRGQILVTQRTGRFLDLPTTGLRQTHEGTVMIGDSKEDVGFDTGTAAHISRTMAARAILAFPHLADVPVVRTWGALRVMTPDSFPIYQSWPELPGVFALGCHSGVTLAAVHAQVLAPAIAAGSLPHETKAFRVERFDVQNSAAA